MSRPSVGLLLLGFILLGSSVQRIPLILISIIAILPSPARSFVVPRPPHPPPQQQQQDEGGLTSKVATGSSSPPPASASSSSSSSSSSLSSLGWRHMMDSTLSEPPATSLLPRGAAKDGGGRGHAPKWLSTLFASLSGQDVTMIASTSYEELTTTTTTTTMTTSTTTTTTTTTTTLEQEAGFETAILSSSPQLLASSGEWGAYLDESTGMVYYFHAVTGEARWTAPFSNFPPVIVSEAQRHFMQQKQREYYNRRGLKNRKQQKQQKEQQNQKKAGIAAGLLGPYYAVVQADEKQQQKLMQPVKEKNVVYSPKAKKEPAVLEAVAEDDYTQSVKSVLIDKWFLQPASGSSQKSSNNNHLPPPQIQSVPASSATAVVVADNETDTNRPLEVSAASLVVPMANHQRSDNRVADHGTDAQVATMEASDTRTSNSGPMDRMPEVLASEGDWNAYWDEPRAFVYYFNTKTGQSQWEPPTGTFPKVVLPSHMFAAKVRQHKDAITSAVKVEDSNNKRQEVDGPRPLASQGDWAAYLDTDRSYMVYYFNRRTGESRWDPPNPFFPKIEVSSQMWNRLVNSMQTQPMRTTPQQPANYDDSKNNVPFWAAPASSSQHQQQQQPNAVDKRPAWMDWLLNTLSGNEGDQNDNRHRNDGLGPTLNVQNYQLRQERRDGTSPAFSIPSRMPLTMTSPPINTTKALEAAVLPLIVEYRRWFPKFLSSFGPLSVNTTLTSTYSAADSQWPLQLWFVNEQNNNNNNNNPVFAWLGGIMSQWKQMQSTVQQAMTIPLMAQHMPSPPKLIPFEMSMNATGISFEHVLLPWIANEHKNPFFAWLTGILSHWKQMQSTTTQPPSLKVPQPPSAEENHSAVIIPLLFGQEFRLRLPFQLPMIGIWKGDDDNNNNNNNYHGPNDNNKSNKRDQAQGSTIIRPERRPSMTPFRAS